MKTLYGIVYYDAEEHKTNYQYGFSKSEAKKFIAQLQLGKDCISSIHIVKMDFSWSAYDGIIYDIKKGGPIYHD